MELHSKLLRTIVLLASGGLWLLPAATAQTVYENYTFTTLAGPPEAGAGSFDGAGGAARFRFPSGAAVDNGGNVYVADTGNHTIRKISPSGAVATLAGLAASSGNTDGTGSAARFNAPAGVAVDTAGNVYVADTSNHTIRKITPAGVVTTLAGLAGSSGSANGTGSAARFDTPEGVAVDTAGNVYVADTRNCTIRKITPAGVVTTLAGSAPKLGSADGTGSAARFYYPFGIAVDGSGNLYVADTYNSTLRKITAAGVVTTLAGTATLTGSTNDTGSAARFNFPVGVGVDNGGNVYLADYGNHEIRKVTSGGVVTTLAGSAGVSGSVDGTGGAARFKNPFAVTVDNGGNVYVADYGNHTIRKVTSGGDVTTLAGLAGGAGGADGAGSAARFNFPAGVALDGGGNAYVADTINHTLRKITAAGVVTTLAGSAGSSGTNDGIGSGARFYQPIGVAVDGSNNVYVADSFNHAIRMITAGGVVTTLAGLGGTSGTNDGVGSGARFNQPFGVAVDGDGNVYVGDTWNHAIRKITPDGSVTTLAGKAGVSGSTNGPGDTARFNFPEHVAVDGAGNVYTADDGNFTVRKITPAGAVTTLAGTAGTNGSMDANGGAALFNYPLGVAVDSSDNVYVGDTGNHIIRKITPAGGVTTLAGIAATSGNADGTGNAALFNSPEGIAVDGAGNVYVADAANHRIMKGHQALPDNPVVDLPFGAVGAVRHLDVANVTTTSWSWSFIRYPAASSARLSSATAQNPTFTPDVADVYVLRFKGTDALGRVALGTVTLVADATPPTINITSPASGQRWSNSVFTVTGTAGDNVGVSNIWYQSNGGNWTNPTGTTNWSAAVTLTAGANTIRAYAVDGSGNVSTTNSVGFTYVAVAPLTVLIHGGGTVTPNYNGQLLEIGKPYSMTAKAASGSGFSNWTGSLATNSPTLGFVMQSNLTFTANFVDVVKPTLTITAPKSGQNWSNAAFTVTGTAKDNVQVAGVWYQLNGNAWTPAGGTTNWTAGVLLTPGANTLKAYAVDADGNASVTNSVAFTYILSDRLTVVISGAGTLTPNYSNALLQLGKSYTMTAKPAAGFVLSNWTDNVAGVVGTTAALTFVMQSNLVLQANFIPNPFLPVAGNYQGLFYDTNGVAQQSSGLFTATVTSKGSFSSKWLLAGKSYSLSGQFSVGGVASNSILRKGLGPLSAQLQLDLAGGEMLSGLVSDGAWTAELIANRAVYSKTNFAPQAGSYTLVLPGSDDAATQPGGDSYGTLTVSTIGGIKFAGVLGDGTKVSQSTIVSRAGQWPLYASLYSGNGSVLGWITFTNQLTDDLNGLVSWIKLAQLSAKLYPGGFTNETEAIGSMYRFTNGVRVLNLSTGIVWLAQGNLGESFTNQVALGLDNKVTNLSSNNLSLSLTTKSGLFKGSATAPGAAKAIPFSGVVLQKQNAGFGYFLGTNQSGEVFFGPAP